MSGFDLASRRFRGTGERPAEHAPLPGAWSQPEPYVAPANLVEAVNVALYLRRPLLLEGEPGCGKTRLAFAVAHELGYPLLEAYVTSSSKARDLLYTFDAVRRLYDIQERVAARAANLATTARDPARVIQYVNPGPLGTSIRLAERGVPSVVLIDEIDKADIDFPNDLLLVLDRLQYTVDEVPGLRYDALQGQTRHARRDVLPLVIITSNREKELPSPFLRRCLFYFIEFPRPLDVAAIVERHFGGALTQMFDEALKKFWELREQPGFSWRKPVSTSELLDWLAVLRRDEERDLLTAAGLASRPLAQLPHLEALVKNQSDRNALLKHPPGSPAPGAGPEARQSAEVADG